MKATKSIWARIMVLCLTVAMVLSVATMGAFAVNTPIQSSSPTGSIYIKGTDRDDNTQVKLYQIIKVNLDENSFQPKDPVYQWVDEVANLLKESKYASYVDADNHNAVTEEFSLKTSAEDEVGATAADLSEFYDALATAIQHKVLELDEPRTATVNGTNVTKLENVPLGQYLIIADNNSAYEHKPATATLYPQWGDHDAGTPDSGSTPDTWYVEDANVVLKGDKGTVDKEVDDPTVGIGDEVTYTVKASVPVYPEDATATAFNVGDTMGTGLTWNGAVTVYWSEDGETYKGTVSAKDSENENIVYYELVPNAVVGEDEEGNNIYVTFEVQFNYKNLVNKYPTAKYVHVEYTATINEHAFEEDALGNDAYLGVNTNPYDDGSYETTDTHEQVYTYGIDVTKVDTTTQAGLAGAEFTLKGADGKEIQFVETGDGVYVKYAAANYEPGDNITPVTTLEVASNGTLQLKGLDIGTYTLTETKAPGGYQLPNDEDAVTTITLTDGDDSTKADGVLDEDATSATGATIVGEVKASGNTVNFQIGNTKPGFELPTTGGMGTVAFTAGGLIIMACGAALVLVTLKKKKAED